MAAPIQVSGRGESAAKQDANSFAWENAGFGNSSPWVVNAITGKGASGSASSDAGLSLPMILGGVALLYFMRKKG